LTAENRDPTEKKSEDDLRLTLGAQGQHASSQKGNASDEKIERLIGLIGNEQFSIRMAASKKLSLLGKKAVPALLEALHEGLWYTRECAIQALGNIGDPRAIEPLINALGDENIGVRRSAAHALSNLIEKDELEAVARAFAQADEDAQKAALETIRKASPLAGRKLKEVLGKGLGPTGKVETKGFVEAASSDDSSPPPETDGGIRALWRRLSRFLESGS
jgi:HEAT repeat protein